MKQYISLLVSGLICIAVHAQRELSSISFQPERNASEALIIVGQDSALHLMITNKKEIQRFDYNPTLSIAARKNYEAPRSKYSEMAGYEVKEDGLINLYYSNSRKNKFCMVTLSPAASESVINELDFKLKKETYLQGISHQNKFYILTIDFKSVVRLYEFNAGNHEVTEFPLAQVKFEPGRDGLRNYLHDHVKTGGSTSVGTSLVDLVDSESPNSIETASAHNKLYVKNGVLRLTVDKDKESTQVIEIALADKELTLKSFDQPLESFDLSDRIDSNSYLYDEKLFQVLVSKNKLVFTVTDYHNGEVIKQIELLKDENIDIANSAIIQEGGDFASYRELEKTSQLLRKMTSAVPGIPVHKTNGIYEITLGGSKEIATGGPMMMGGFGLGGAVGGLILTATLNPTLGAYNSYTRTKSTYFISLFDDDFNHIDGAVTPNVFDKIRDYTDRKSTSIETIFRYQKSFVYGYYDNVDQQYKLVLFED